MSTAIQHSKFNIQHSAGAVPRSGNYYAYGGALLAAQILIDRIAPYCRCKPQITGDLAERKAAVNEIEITCIPEKSTRRDVSHTSASRAGLFTQTPNPVIQHLAQTYNLKKGMSAEASAQADPPSVHLTFMTIPTTIHFKTIGE